jgi:hypothetical protein
MPARQQLLKKMVPKPNAFSLLAVIAIIALTAGLRVHLLDVPLERDEGEYAYAAQLIMNGMHPYQHVYSLKLPGVFLAYAGIMGVFGETAYGIHLGLLLLSALTALIIFASARRLFGTGGGLAAAAAFAVLSVAQSVMGTFAHSEHFVIAAAVVGFFLLLQENADDGCARFFLSGLAFGIGFLMKQHGAAFIVFGACGVVLAGPGLRKENLRNLVTRELIYGLGCALPYLLTCLWFAVLGSFDRFWFWTVEYARAYTALIPLAHAWRLFCDAALPILKTAPLLWVLFAWGAFGLFWNAELRRAKPWLAAFLIFSFTAILPGFYFREHYFLLIMPAAAMIIGSGIPSLQHLAARWITNGSTRAAIAWFVLILCIGHSVYVQRQFLFFITPHQASRSTYGLNPFPESIEIARFLQERTSPEERIAVIGSEPQIYFYARRQAVTGYIYMYPMMEKHSFAGKMQDEFIAEIEAASPRYLVYTRVFSSWLQRPDSAPQLFQWLDQTQTGYTLVGLADILPQGTRYSWAPNLRWPPQSPAWIAVLERNDQHKPRKPAP